MTVQADHGASGEPPTAVPVSNPGKRVGTCLDRDVASYFWTFAGLVLNIGRGCRCHAGSYSSCHSGLWANASHLSDGDGDVVWVGVVVFGRQTETGTVSSWRELHTTDLCRSWNRLVTPITDVEHHRRWHPEVVSTSPIRNQC
jgi:hypothetical protein